MKHPFRFIQFIAMITSHQLLTYLCEIRAGKTERGMMKRGRRERQRNRLRGRERGSLGLKWF